MTVENRSIAGSEQFHAGLFLKLLFKTLKSEEVYLTDYESYDDVLASIPRFVEAVYNAKRLHSSLTYMAPNEIEQLWKNGELKKHGINPSFKLKGNHSN